MDMTVLLKRVPDLVEDLEVDDSGKALDEDSVSLKLNEFDDHALEEALLLKEGGGGTVTVIALDGEDVDKMLYTALAKGADRALKVMGGDPDGGNQALAGIFVAALDGHGGDLILTGVQAADDRDGQLAPRVGALLGRPCIEVVTEVNPGDGKVTVHKELAGGVVAEYEVDLPAVLGIQAARQTPRYAPVSRVRQIQESATIDTVTSAATEGAGFTVVAMTPPETGEGAQMLDGVDELVKVLDAKGVI